MRVKGSIETNAYPCGHRGKRRQHKASYTIRRSASAWRESFKDLKARGLDGSSVQLGIMDGLLGLEKVFAEEFPNAMSGSCGKECPCKGASETEKDSS